jgi:hypothetical protein
MLAQQQKCRIIARSSYGVKVLAEALDRQNSAALDRPIRAYREREEGQPRRYRRAVKNQSEKSSLIFDTDYLKTSTSIVVRLPIA